MKMTPDKLTLARWNELQYEYAKTDGKAVYMKCPFALRIDGTQLSVARFYGGFTFNGKNYTVFECREVKGEFTCKYATIGVRFDFLEWVTKKLKEENK